MEHPNSKCRIAQAEYLSRLPEEERENKARDIRIGNASYIYHQQAVPIQENRLIMYYKEWLEGLPPNISRHMRMLGFEACKTMIPFTRYVNERNDIGMRDWMQEHLSPSDFNYWQKLTLALFLLRFTRTPGAILKLRLNRVPMPLPPVCVF